MASECPPPPKLQSSHRECVAYRVELNTHNPNLTVLVARDSMQNRDSPPVIRFRYTTDAVALHWHTCDPHSESFLFVSTALHSETFNFKRKTSDIEEGIAIHRLVSDEELFMQRLRADIQMYDEDFMDYEPIHRFLTPDHMKEHTSWVSIEVHFDGELNGIPMDISLQKHIHQGSSIWMGKQGSMKRTPVASRITNFKCIPQWMLESLTTRCGMYLTSVTFGPSGENPLFPRTGITIPHPLLNSDERYEHIRAEAEESVEETMCEWGFGDGVSHLTKSAARS